MSTKSSFLWFARWRINLHGYDEWKDGRWYIEVSFNGKYGFTIKGWRSNLVRGWYRRL